jgi:hypothetical protein
MHLQRTMSRLRNLGMSVCVYGTSVLRRGWIGHNLQELHISVTKSRSFHFPCLSMFIRDAGIILFRGLTDDFEAHLMTSMFSCTHSIDDQLRPNADVFSIKTPFDARPSSALSVMLGTLDDIILYCPNPSRLEDHCLGMSLGANSLKSSAT